MLKQGNGEEITGQDLARVVDLARQMRRVLEAFPTHYPRHILEQAAIAGAFVPGAVDADLIHSETAGRQYCRAPCRRPA